MANRQPDFAKGKNVKEAKESIEVTVTKNDIAKGKRKSVGECALAQALKRQDPSIKEVAVKKSVTYISRRIGKGKEEEITRYVNPVSTQQEIVAFDRGGKIAEGTVKINAPAQSQTLAAISDSNYTRKSYVPLAPKPKQKIRFTPDIR